MIIVFSFGVSCSNRTKDTGQKVLILGVDGMDPLLLDKFMAKGEMPNLKKLMEMGDYKLLTSSTPPQSPVAWSNFITGQNPGKHGIYDFIHRDPESYMPYLSTSKTEPASEDDSIVIGRRVIWLEGGKAELLRQGKPFWEYLAEAGIYNRIFKIPANFPPYEGKGWTGAGMGTPDILGTYGTFTFFTDNPPEHAEEIGGGTIVPVYFSGNMIKTVFRGPDNIYELDERKPYLGRGENKRRNYAESEVPVTIYVDRAHPQIKIEFQDQEVMLSEGEWSGFVPITFPMWPHIVEVKGIVRFYLKSVKPDFQLYASPINMDPFDPPIPVSSPPEYAAAIADDLGYFYTQGMPEDTKGRQADLDILNDIELFNQMMLIYKEDLAMFDWHLDNFKDGLLFYYFSTLDLGTHMFWRLHDPTHPSYDAEWAKKMGDPIETLYKKMDHVVGVALDRLDDKTTLIVMSDHGFGSWEKSFQVNTWLHENGYLKLNSGVELSDVEYFRNKSNFQFAVDWSRTLAYGLGINGVYINTAGREKYGAVSKDRQRELVDEIARKLLAYVDPETGERPVLKVYKSYETYHGDHTDIAPDIIVGYKRGYRGGDKSALGKFPEQIITINESSWSGDHCIATSEVPGIIVTNKKIKKTDPALIDMGPSILSLFGRPVPGDMDGKPIF